MEPQSTEISAPTIAERIQEKNRKIKMWEEANPGYLWCNPEAPEEESKIFISKEMIGSEAYRSLSKIALLMYHDFLAKRIMKPIKRNKQKYWVCENNGQIVYPYSEAEAKGISRTQFRNGIDELQTTGFIDITHQGKGGRPPQKGTGDMTTYWLDVRWMDYGTDAFKPPRNPRKPDKRKDRGFQSMWNDPERKKVLLEKQNAARSAKNSKPSIEINTR